MALPKEEFLKKMAEGRAKAKAEKEAKAQQSTPRPAAPAQDTRVKRPLSDLFGFHRKEALASAGVKPSVKPATPKTEPAKAQKAAPKSAPFNWWYAGMFTFGAFALLGGGMYATTRNVAGIMLLILFAGLAYLCYWRASKDIPSVPTLTIEAPTTGAVNCLCIYGVKDTYGISKAVKIQFEWRTDGTELLGDRWCFEDLGNKWMAVIYQDVENGGKWTAFELPDAKYTDPARLAIPLNMSAVQEWRKLEPGMFEKLKPLIMVGANALVLFFIFLISSNQAGK